MNKKRCISALKCTAFVAAIFGLGYGVIWLYENGFTTLGTIVLIVSSLILTFIAFYVASAIWITEEDK